MEEPKFDTINKIPAEKLGMVSWILALVCITALILYTLTDFNLTEALFVGVGVIAANASGFAAGMSFMKQIKKENEDVEHGEPSEIAND